MMKTVDTKQLLTDEAREYQKRFLEHFGPEFDKFTVERGWMGASPDGAYLAFWWKHAEGEFRLSIPFTRAEDFVRSFYIAFHTACERLQARGIQIDPLADMQTKGQA